MRGKVYGGKNYENSCRITPAYAGKRDVGNVRCKCKWDHPRLCGEKLFVFRCIYHNIGSPPPMRGKGTKVFQQIQKSRITPAYAGKSTARYQIQLKLTDHPRLCGEK